MLLVLVPQVVEDNFLVLQYRLEETEVKQQQAEEQ
jgi:hypothetical protein